jgi:hypothetical protein
MFTEYKNYFCLDYEVQGPEFESTVNLFRSTVDSFLNNEAYKKYVINGYLAYKQIVDFDINNQKFKVVSSEGWSLGGEDFYEELEIKMFDDNKVCDRAILRTYYEDGHKDKVLSTYIGYQKIDVSGKEINIHESEDTLRAFQLIQKINPQLIVKTTELVV